MYCIYCGPFKTESRKCVLCFELSIAYNLVEIMRQIVPCMLTSMAQSLSMSGFIVLTVTAIFCTVVTMIC